VKREIPLYTLEGVIDCDVTTHYFSTEDGLGLSMLRFNRDPKNEAGDSIMIVHGLTTSTDMFIMPEHYNLVSYLLDNGYTDVWCLDMRMSNRHQYNLFPHRYSFDHIAKYDYPPAIDIIRQHVGAERRLHIIGHCLGSVTLMMSLYGKAIDGIASMTVNSVALTPRVPKWSSLKLQMAPTMVEHVLGFPNLNPMWTHDPTLTRGKIFSKAISMFHRECDVPECHMLSLMWGTGWPALYSHENLADITHRRGGDLYGATSLHYYRCVNKMVRAGSRPLKYDPSDPSLDSLPDDYFVHAREIDTPVLLTTGEDNYVFTDSNIVCHDRLKGLGATNTELVVYPKYGHQDVFMGEHVARDCFPAMLDFIRRHSEPAGVPAGNGRHEAVMTG
jgi:cholesterol oxidase